MSFTIGPDSGTATIDQVRAVAEPIRLYNFQMIITPPGFVGADVQEISLRCQATSLPGRRITPIPYTLSKFTVGVSGRVDYEHQWTTVLLEGVDAAIHKLIGVWMNHAFNAYNGKGAYMPDIMATANLYLLDSMDVVISSRVLYNIWPIDFPRIDVNAGENALVSMPVTWWYDWWDDLDRTAQANEP